jgi:hypothetical protein
MYNKVSSAFFQCIAVVNCMGGDKSTYTLIADYIVEIMILSNNVRNAYVK